MPDQHAIYARHADQYDRLVRREDHDGRLLPALQVVRSLERLDIVELGAGTGRLTLLLAPLARRVWAFDASRHMLARAAAKLQRGRLPHVRLAVADHRALPVASGSADMAVAGWSLCYLVVDHPLTWREQLWRGLCEMRRVLRPGGTILLLETLGTGHEVPQRMGLLSDYYAFLEQAGFASSWIRTDYRFESLAEAEALVRFFFGDDLAAQVVDRGRVDLPECTGLWWLSV
ncbi:MAG TPA: class I SAM-dependent methyltransferase [Anaerolineae bacterium]|nr:class I SAM-dependent methyltransferase [Anaerolineae bacterium]